MKAAAATCAPAVASPWAALDIDGVAAIGIERWRSGYAWPVSDEEYDRLSAAVWDSILAAAAGLSGREQDVLKADIGMPGFLLQHMHLSAAATRLRQSSSGVPYGRHVAAHLTPDWVAVGEAFAEPARAPSQIGLGARALAKNWILNSSAPLWSRFAACFGRAKAWALGSRSDMREAYLAQHNIACRYLAIEDFPLAAAAPIRSDLERAVRRCIDTMDVAAQHLFGISFDSERAAGAWMRRLNDLCALVAAVDHIRQLPDQLLLTNVGRSEIRAVALAMRRRGVETVGFHHGNDMGGQPSPAGDIVDLLAVGRFVVPSAASLRWRQHEYERSHAAQIHPVRFEKTALPQYRQWLEAARQTKLPQKIKTVMIVGFPPNWIRYPHRAAHWALTQLDVEAALIDVLDRAGFRVLYKAHPEFEQETRTLFKGMACSFVGGNLEDCWQLADAFVFPRISSTSFGFAVCTNRPIVLLDVDSQDWVEDAYALLARRCRMVPASVDEELRIRFDEKTLIETLRAPVAAPDESYVTEAMCS